MRIVQFVRTEQGGTPRAGIETAGGILDPAATWPQDREPFPTDSITLLANPEARAYCERLLAAPGHGRIYRPGEVTLLAPLPRPNSVRDFYAFEEHVRTARGKRGLEVPEEWYEFPTFYFSNHSAIFGPGQAVPAPVHTEELDFELEIACVIGRAGRDIAIEDAGGHIAGYCIMNDWSARDIQRREMRIGLGPAKGKDFATSIGPALITPDEIADARAGKGYDLEMEAKRNGKTIARGNWKTIHWSFEEMIAWASRDAWLHPGDLLGSGTVGGGCILEIGPNAAGGWLAAGDRIDLTVARLGTLTTLLTTSP